MSTTHESSDPIFPSSDLEDGDAISFDDDDDDDTDEDDHQLTQPQTQTLHDVVPDPSSSDPDDVVIPISSSSVTVAVTPPPPPPPPPHPPSSVTVALPDPHRHLNAVPINERKPIDDSRRLFQRLWTDEDEIELLQGFLDYTASRGATASGHYHDTAAFYDQIKNKLQLEFNKNQLVEKLRRLKKKYRTVLGKMNSGKDFVFKSPHDHATFEISKKIWSNLPGSYRGGGVEFDDVDHNPNPVTVVAATPPRPSNSSYIVSHINLNSVSPGGGSGGSGGGFDMMLTSLGGNGGGLPKLCTRKRSRVANSEKLEEKFVKTEGGISNTNNASPNNNNNNNALNNSVVLNNVTSNVGVSPPLQGLVEETVRNCLSPVLKDLISNAVSGATNASPNGGGSPGFKGVGELALNAVPLNFSGVNVGERNVGGMDGKWRKQQILELEVYSKRLELVQDQIKSSLEELRSMES